MYNFPKMLIQHNFFFLNFSNIKMSSPMINNIIIAGSIVMFTSVIITTFDYGNLLTDAFDAHVCMVSKYAQDGVKRSQLKRR